MGLVAVEDDGEPTFPGQGEVGLEDGNLLVHRYGDEPVQATLADGGRSVQVVGDLPAFGKPVWMGADREELPLRPRPPPQFRPLGGVGSGEEEPTHPDRTGPGQHIEPVSVESRIVEMTVGVEHAAPPG